MTGQQVIDVLKQQCQPAGSSRPFLHLGVSAGLTYDLAKTFTVVTLPTGGTRTDCATITVSNVRLNGAPLDPAATYGVTVNNFLADGGDNFTVFATVDPSLRIGAGIDLDETNRYLAANSPVAPPGTNRVNEVPA